MSAGSHSSASLVNPSNFSRAAELLRAYGAALAAGVYVLILLYTGLMPFAPRTMPVPDAVRWLGLTLQSNGLGDVLCNIALYIPLGVLLPMCRPLRRWIVRCGLTLGVALAASVVVEFAQLRIDGRIPSWVDVVCNLAGVGIGIVLSPLVAAALKGLWASIAQKLAASPFSVAALVLSVVLLMQAALPFDAPGTSPSRIYRACKQAYLQPFERMDRLQLEELAAWYTGHVNHAATVRQQRYELWCDLAAAGVCYFVLAGVLVVGLRNEYGFGRIAASALVLWSCTMLAVASGLLCLLTVRAPFDITVSAAHIVGALVGLIAANLALWWSGSTLRFSSLARLWPALLIGQAIYIGCRTLLPFNFFSADGGWHVWGHHQFEWFPFFTYLHSPLPQVVEQICATLVQYGVLGAALCMAWRGLAVVHPGSVLRRVALVAGALAIVLEVLQAPLPTRYADITTVLIGVAGAGLGALGYCWAVDLWRASRDRQDETHHGDAARIGATPSLDVVPVSVGIGVYDD